MYTTKRQCRACALAVAFVMVSVCSFHLGMVYRELQAVGRDPRADVGTRQAVASMNGTALTLQATATSASPVPTGSGDGNALPLAQAGVPQVPQGSSASQAGWFASFHLTVISLLS